MNELPPALAPLAAYRRFVTYDLTPDPDRPGKTIKRPTDVATGLWCNSNLPAHQYSFDEATATGRPVGFVMNETDGFWFVDIDSCATPDGQWNQLATELCAALAGAAVEISQSGTGLHIIGRGTAPEHSCRNIPLNLEFYTHERFVALTGKAAAGDVRTDCSAAIADIAARYFPPNAHGDIAGWTDEPVDEWSGPADDAELLRAALASGKRSASSAFGGKHVGFDDLWTANEDALAARWPGSTGGYDGSQADAALASHLAYWTGKNCERIRDLMFQSDLVREKWENRPAYVDTTIMKACAIVSNVAKKQPRGETPPADVAEAAGIELRDTAEGYLTAADQLEFFAGCVYVVDENKIWIPRTGDRLDKARFDVVYAGHIFAIDNLNEKTTDSAYDAFTKSLSFTAPKADRTCFRPEHPPGVVLHEDARTLVNTYIPVNPPRKAGDIGPFKRHMDKLFPVERDQAIILHYMASVIRNPGLKAQWWPLIQGAEGNGKSFLNRLMSFCVGLRYAHLVNPEAMAKTGNQFNSWVEGNLFLGIEEIYLGAHRRDFLDSFKTTVTDDRIATEGKGGNQRTGDNRLNGMLFTNHTDAVPITIDSRRYCIFLTPQQTYSDILRDGMGGTYFPDFYDWFYGRKSFAAEGPMHGASIINEWLHNYTLTAELDPAQLCVRAPTTSTTERVIRLSLGTAEQEILEAIEESRPGFAGGWVSSIAIDRLLDSVKARVPRTKRRDMMNSLGYDYHPALPDGRVNNTVAPDNGKPRLYIKVGHLAGNFTEVVAIAKAYTAAQGNNPAAQAAFGSN